MNVMYGVYHPGLDRWAGTRFDWTQVENDDVILLHSRDAAELFRREAIWEKEAFVKEAIVSKDKPHS